MNTLSQYQMLELVARACGIEVELYENDYGEIESSWNPLVDNGDAFAVALRAGLTVDFKKLAVTSGSVYKPFWFKHPDNMETAAQAIRESITLAVATSQWEKEQTTQENSQDGIHS